MAEIGILDCIGRPKSTDIPSCGGQEGRLGSSEDYAGRPKVLIHFFIGVTIWGEGVVCAFLFVLFQVPPLPHFYEKTCLAGDTGDTTKTRLYTTTTDYCCMQ